MRVVVISPKAQRQIKKLLKWDILIKKKIEIWILLLKTSNIPSPPKITWLKWELKPFYKCKIPPIRLLFTLRNDDKIVIQKVRLRKDAYK